MPGVNVTVGAVSGPSAPTLAPSSKYFAVGLAERGLTTEPTRVTSFAQFQELFGARTTYSALWDDIRTFFEEGGTEAYAVRVVGPAATTGTLTGGLQDQQGTPATTLNVAARSAGAWSSGLTIQVMAGPTAATYRLVVRLGGVVVHDWTNLRDPEEAVSRSSTSPYVKITNAGSPAVAPQNNPAVAAATALGAGTDDRASVTATHYVNALALFTTELGDGAVAIPGIGTTVHAGLIAHADASNRIALLAAASTTDKATLISTAAALDAKRAGLFAPWIKIPDEYGGGGTRTISPEGYVAAARARAHAEGPWRAPAGDMSTARYVVGPATVFTGVDGNDLDSAKVNVIRTISRTTRLYGWVSLAADRDNWGFLTGADTVNRVVTEAYRQLEPYLFGVIDARGHLLGKIAGTLEGIVAPMADRNGLYARLNPADPTGPPLDPGYRVRVLDINPVEVAAQNKVLAELGIRVSPTAAIVQLTVTKAAVTAAL
jgi:hypothetical protein